MTRFLALLHNECAKLAARRSFYAALIALVLCTLGGGLVKYHLLGGDAPLEALPSQQRTAQLFEERNGWAVLAASWQSGAMAAALWLALLSAASIAEERRHRTLAGIFARPVRRAEVYAAKFCTLALAAVLAAALVSLTAHLSGGLSYGYSDLFHAFLVHDATTVTWVWQPNPDFSYDELFRAQLSLVFWLPAALLTFVSVSLGVSALCQSLGQAITVLLVLMAALLAARELSTAWHGDLHLALFPEYLLLDLKRLALCARTLNDADLPFDDRYLARPLPRAAVSASWALAFTALGLGFFLRRDELG